MTRQEAKEEIRKKLSELKRTNQISDEIDYRCAKNILDKQQNHYMGHRLICARCRHYFYLTDYEISKLDDYEVHDEICDFCKFVRSL